VACRERVKRLAPNTWPNTTIQVQARSTNKQAPSEGRSKNFGFDDDRSAAAPIRARVGRIEHSGRQTPGMESQACSYARKRSRLGAA
jgi:hypothetical protein